MFRGTLHPNNIVIHLKDNNGKCLKCSENQGSTLCVSLLCGNCCNDYDLFCPKHHLRRPLKSKQNIKFSTSLKILPPWIKYPHYQRYNIMWRMGEGEDYWHNFWSKYSDLSLKEKKWYQQDFPAPESWNNIYLDMSDYKM